MSGRSGVNSAAMTSSDLADETDYLLASPANAERLVAAAADVRDGQPLIPKTMGELRSLAAEGD